MTAAGAAGAGEPERERIGPYRVVKAIGAGGSARIDLARLDRVYGFQRHVVIKRPLEHLRGDARAAASLRREARIGGLLRHPNLVAVLDAGEHAGYDYLVLEYVHGASLRALMQTDTGARVRDVPLGTALTITAEVARALHHAHEVADDAGAPLGLVHRDVSPGNVLLAADGAVKLADFGIAKETRVATLSGSMHGTVTYMAPEQCRGHAFDRRADIFSLGVICYELVTGTRLFWADNDVASLHRVLSGTITRPRKLRPSVSSTLEELVMTALAPDPSRRFATADALAAALDGHAALIGEPLAARHVARWIAEVLGPDHARAPWAAPVGPSRASSSEERSLVDAIAAAPDDAAPPVPTFGPSDAAIDDSTTDRHPPTTTVTRRRRSLRAALAAGLVVPALALVLAARGAQPADRPDVGHPPATHLGPGQPPAGQPPTGQPLPGPPPAGQPLPGQPPTGQPLPGPPPAGQPPAGQPPAGQPPAGQPLPGHRLAGQPPAGQPLPGQPLLGQPPAGQPPAGQPLPGQPLPGQPPAGQPPAGPNTPSGSAAPRTSSSPATAGVPAKPGRGEQRATAGRPPVHEGPDARLDDTSRATTPRETASRKTAPSETATRVVSPREAAPHEAAPRQAAPREAAPREAAPRDERSSAEVKPEGPTGRPKADVKWNPTLLLPSDRGSGAKR